MRRATTILRLIDNLECELYKNYTKEEIQAALIKEEKNGRFIRCC